MMGLHQLSPSRSFLVAYGTDDDPVERDSLGTAIGCLVHAGRLSNPRGNCQFKMNDPLRCYISETLTEPFCRCGFLLGYVPAPGTTQDSLRLRGVALSGAYRPICRSAHSCSSPVPTRFECLLVSPM